MNGLRQTVAPGDAAYLAERIRGGDESAFELFYRMEFLNLVHFAGSYLRDGEKARDIAQDSLLTLWEHRQTLRGEGNIRALVFTIARNRTLNLLRTEKLFSRASEVSEEALLMLEDASVEEEIMALDLADLLRREWALLPEKIKATFFLSRHEGLKNKEISHKEGITEKAVEYRIGKALKYFKRIFSA